MSHKLRVWLFIIVLIQTPSLCAQNLSWLRTDGIQGPNSGGSSTVYQMETDEAGDVYTTIFYQGSITIGAGADEVAVTADNDGSVLLIRQNSDGDLVWYQNLLLYGEEHELSVAADGRVLMVGEVRGDLNTTFQGEPIVTDPLTDYLLYVWFNADGSIDHWNFTDEIFEDFRLERLADLKLLDDGSFWLAGGYTKERQLPAGGLIRQDIGFVSLFDADTKAIQRNHFDAGEREGQPTSWMIVLGFHETSNGFYAFAVGNGFYGFSDGEEFNRSQHAFLMKINGSNTLDLVMATTDVEDKINSLLVHEDGSVSMAGYASGGFLETSVGSYDLRNLQPEFLINISESTLNSAISMPGIAALRKVEEDDELIGASIYKRETLTFPDGYGNTINLPPGTEQNPMVAFYNKQAQLESYHILDESTEGSIQLTTFLPISACKGFYLGGFTLGKVDLDLSESGVAYANPRGSGVYFYTKNTKEPPVVEVEEAYPFCGSTPINFDFVVKDALLSQLTVSVSSPNGDFDPSQVIISGTGQERSIDLDQLSLTSDVLVRIKAEDACGAFTEKDVWVRIIAPPPPPILSEQGDYYLCPGDTLRLYTNASSPLTWSNGSVTDTLEVYAAGEYWAAQLPGTGCQGEASETLRVFMATPPERPEITSSGGFVICVGQSVVLSASLSEGLVWSTGETSQSITVSEAGTYSVYQTSEHCGNSELSSVEVEVVDLPAQPVITVIGDSQFCEGNQTVLRSSVAEGNLWSTGETTQEIVISASGSYTVAVQAGNCRGPLSEVVEIRVDEPFALNMVSDTTVCGFFEPLELIPEVDMAGLDFKWSDGSSLSSLLVTEKGEYWVEVSNGSCIERAYVRVGEACVPVVFMPTAFSPNGDDENDHFGAIGAQAIDFRMNIYNQWGKLVFVGTGIDQGWDGTLDGKKAPAGKYMYQISYKGLINGQLVDYGKTGRLDLIR